MRSGKSVSSLQDALAELMGCAPADRAAVVLSMLRRSPRESTAYWLQLVVSVGIATLGLVLGSTAVVIGAMLIAPLMLPIVGLGMGLAVGSPFLVLRSGARIVLSVLVAVGSSALMTRLLPFNELNSELAARITPTALDLLVAAFCAVAGVHASMRPSSDVASAAAGTSIGISLVPPLCTSGYGLGTASPEIAGGAALLFLTNFVAIVVVGTFAFAAVGFNQVPVMELEAEQLTSAESPRSRKLAGQLERLFASRSGPWLRLLMPLALLAAVYLPLREALDEVAWQVRNRAAVQAVVAGLPVRVVQSRIHVERGAITISLVVLGGTREAQQAEARLESEVTRSTGSNPKVEVIAVADARSLAGLEAELRKPDTALPVIEPRSKLPADLREVESAVQRIWPAESAGAVLSVSAARRDEYTDIVVTHWGVPIAAPGREVIERSVREELELSARLTTRALPVEPLVHVEGEIAAFIAACSAPIQWAISLADVWICIERPEPSEPPREESDENLALATLQRLTANHRRTKFTAGPRLSLRFSKEECPTLAAVADAGADAGAATAP